MLLHHILRTQTIQLPAIISYEKQILLIQSEHLQITASFDTFYRYQASLKSTRKNSIFITDIPTSAVKIAPDLWEFKNDKERLPGFLPMLKRQMIINGCIRIWNMATKKYETEMELTTEKKIYKMYCDNEETYYSADGVEFFTFTSIIH